MIYELATVARVKSCYTELCVSLLDTLRGGDDYMQHCREKMADELIHYCHPLGVELHPADIRFMTKEEEKFHGGGPMIHIRAYWQPSDDLPVEFERGPIDGTVQRLPRENMFKPWFVPVFGAFRWEPAEHPDAIIQPTILEYDYAGWNEHTRQWVYRLK